jgi:hypothetical protein
MAYLGGYSKYHMAHGATDKKLNTYCNNIIRRENMVTKCIGLQKMMYHYHAICFKVRMVLHILEKYYF